MENTKLNFEPVVNVSLAKQISERILESITDGTLKADDPSTPDVNEAWEESPVKKRGRPKKEG